MDPLVREYLRGDERARDALVSRYSPLAESASKRYPALDPDDAFSEALLVIDRKLPELDWENNPTAYLTNAINDWLRSKERDARRRQGKEGPSLDTPLGDDGSRLGELVEWIGTSPEDHACIASDLAPALSRLCKRQRRVYALHVSGRLCVPMIASRLGRSQAEVKASLKGAKQRIKGLGTLPNSDEVSFKTKPRNRGGRPRTGRKKEVCGFSADREVLDLLSDLEDELGGNRSEVVCFAIRQLGKRVAAKKSANDPPQAPTP